MDDHQLLTEWQQSISRGKCPYLDQDGTKAIEYAWALTLHCVKRRLFPLTDSVLLELPLTSTYEVYENGVYCFLKAGNKMLSVGHCGASTEEAKKDALNKACDYYNKLVDSDSIVFRAFPMLSHETHPMW